ncbi:MAG: flagellar basal body P-ring protein FlgI [Phycisphaerales bacterium]|nr:flagellar basal body P-ring protein FlgI [Phycisphaerales bacterium]
MSSPMWKTVRTAALALTILTLAACSGGSKKQVERVQVQPREVPAPLRGTVGSLAQSSAGQPILVSGFGLIVGLNGTGGGLLDERIAATMEREMALMGVGPSSGAENTALQDPITGQFRSPAEVLRDKNVAVVLVQAVLPRGAPANYQFDAYVQAVNATSLEGGRLWTTKLRLGPVGVFGAVQTREIAEARGDLFINPFEDPADDYKSRTVGRVLAGGRVTDPLPIRLTLDVPSHQRSRLVTHAVNSRFPERAHAREPAAKGHDDSMIELHVPQSLEGMPNEFLRIVEHLPIEQSYPRERAQAYIDAMEQNPELLEDLTWCLVALGDPALPYTRELYESSDPARRMAGLRAGAMLGDARAAPPLLELSTTGSAAERSDAIALLSEIDGGPSVDTTLRALLEHPTMTTRIAAYEALARRAERAEYARLLSIEASRPASSGMARTPEELMLISRLSIPARSLQGIQRVTIPGKFVLDIAPFGEPLVYVTQQGTPRIVLFGENLQLNRPLLASAWEDRLLIVSDSAADPPRLRYQDYKTGSVRIEQISPSVADLVIFLAKDPRPEDKMPGLGLTYSEVVGALYALYDAGATTAAFATETDRLMAELVEASRTGTLLDRPETMAEKDNPKVAEEGLAVDISYLKAERARKPQVVPLPPKKPKK